MKLVDRELTSQTQWIVGRTPYFISHHEDGDELWQSNRPFGVNDRLFKFPVGYVPTLEDVDAILKDAIPNDLARL